MSFRNPITSLTADAIGSGSFGGSYAVTGLFRIGPGTGSHVDIGELANGHLGLAFYGPDGVTPLILLDAGVGDGAIDGAQINAETIDTAQLAIGAVDAAAIADGAVTAAAIAANAITAVAIHADAVTTAALAADAVTAAKIAADAVGTSELAANAVTAAELAANAVTAAAIAVDAVTAAAIAADAVGTAEIATDAVTSAEIAAGAVTTAELAAGAVTATELASNAVTAVKIAANAVTNGKIATGAVVAGVIAAGVVGATEIAANAIVAGKIAAGVVTATELAANSVVAGKVAAGAVDGMTITGALLRTAASGKRWEIASGSVDSLVAYTGNAAETLAGAIVVGDTGGATPAPSLTVNSPNFGHGQAILQLLGDTAAAAGQVKITAGDLTANPPVVEAPQFGMGAPRQLSGGSVTATTSAGGVITVNHGLGAAPSTVVAVAGGNSRLVTAANFTATSFDLTVWNSATGAVVASTSLTLRWLAFV